MDESASGGRMSTRALECRCKATEEDGLRSSRSRVDKIRTTCVDPMNQLSVCLVHEWLSDAPVVDPTIPLFSSTASRN